MNIHPITERDARILLSALTEPADSVVGQMSRIWGPQQVLRGLFGEGRDNPASGDFLRFERAEVEKARKRLYPRLSDGLLVDLRKRIAHYGITVLIPGDAKWPTGLDDLNERAPWCLYVRGDAQELAELDKGPSVAIVGARAATSYGEHVTMQLASELAERGYPIVSGAAYGIDGAAHRAALAAGGRTIAFLAGGVERPYPAGHSDLIERISRAGAVVSEVPPGSAPTKWRFLARNRLIAAASMATVVVEAGFRSGSLNTAGHAVSLKRPLGAVPGPVTSAASAGCHRLLAEGATIITSADDVLPLLGVHEPPRSVTLEGEPLFGGATWPAPQA